MDFAYSEEQEMLRAQVRSFLDDKFPAERVVELADADDYSDEIAWKEMAQLGWLGLSVPVARGGIGFGFLEESVLFEELGRALFVGPYFSTVGLCLPALAESVDAIDRVMAGDASATIAVDETNSDSYLGGTDSLQTVAERHGSSWHLTGQKVLVADATVVTDFIVAASTEDGPGLFCVPSKETSVEAVSTSDSTRRMATVGFHQSTGELLADEGGPTVDLLETIRQRSLAALALEAVGIAQRVIDLAVDYSKEREQFGKPIGTYQAVAHQLADSFIDCELARSLAYWASWAVARDDASAERAVAAAISKSVDAAVTACERSIQVHGGIGFTWEHILHRYYKRALWIQAFVGFPAVHRKKLATSALYT